MSLLTEALLLGFTSALAASLYGIAALWAASGESAWLLRWTPLAILWAALVPIGAYELMAMYSAQAAVIVGPIMLWRFVAWRRSGTPPVAATTARFQFTLIGLLQGILVVAVIFALVRDPAPPTSSLGLHIYWPGYVAAGVTLGITTLGAAWLAWGSRRWRRLAVAFFLLTFLNPFMPYIWLRSRQNFAASDAKTGLFWGIPIDILHPLVMLLVMWLIVAAGWAWRQSASERRAQAPTPRVQRVAVAALLLVALCHLGYVYRILLGPGPPPVATLPKPNGYDRVQAAAGRLNWSAISMGDFETATVEACQVFAADNAENLAQIRAGLAMPSRVPVRYSEDYLTVTMNNPNNVRNLCRGLAAVAKAAAAKGLFPDAVQCYLDMVRIARQGADGGLLIDEIVANSTAGIGLDYLAGTFANLDAAALQRLAAELEQLSLAREPLMATIERDRHWGLSILGWNWRLWNWLDDRQHNPVTSAAARARRRVDAMTRLIYTEAAIRAYIQAEGSPPESLQALVPNFLSAVPQDPYGQGLLVYRRTPTNYLLYSVGGNGTDDGGHRATQDEATRLSIGDLFFDAGFFVLSDSDK